MSRTYFVPVLLAGLLLASVPVVAQAPNRTVPTGSIATTLPTPAPTPAYDLLDNIEDTWVNLNPWQPRPMLEADGLIYAVNTHLNTVVEFDGSLQAINTYRTLWGPVSLARHIAPGEGEGRDRLLVVCMLSNSLMILNRLSGDVLDIVALPPEPSDIVVKADEHVAFISTSGRDVVVEVDLLNPQNPLVEYAIPSRNPGFLSLTSDGGVLVAARWSGNNSAVHRHTNNEFNTQANVNSILNLDDTAVATAPGLLDEDVFWLDRSAGVAVPVAREMGTILLAQSINPSTGELWQLNTEANNKDPNKQTEPAIKGFISTNRLSRATLATPMGSAVVEPSTITDLDTLHSGGSSYSRDKSVGLPYSLDFASYGYGFITGLLSDNVTVLDTSGGFVTEWNVPDGCIPRQVLIYSTDHFALVYCAGLNQIPIYQLTSLNPPLFTTLDIGKDPTPEPIREGRRIFYDGTNSLHNNASCATCHDEGRLDLVAWNLSNGEIDNKGPMVTQTLTSINRATPFHWRGEQQRNLLDFNDAFVNLLGATNPLDESPGGDFENFERFVLALETPANPNQHLDRILDNGIQPPTLSPDQVIGSALDGKVIYRQRCEGCHHLPTGTSNDIIGDGAVFKEPMPKRQWIQVAHLLSVHMKGLQTDRTVSLQGGVNQEYPALGVGLAHSGNPRNIFHFLKFFFQNPFDPQGTSDGANFLFQFDTGLAPAVHTQVLLNTQTSTAAQQFLNTYLIPQASVATRNCDIAVFGKTDIGGTVRVAGWAYDRVQNDFVRDDGVRQTLSFFTNQVALTSDWFVFLGQPVGSAQGFAIDYDRDDFLNALEQRSPVDGRFVVDTDGDTWWDGHEDQNFGDPFDPLVIPNDTTNPTILNTPPSFQWSTSKVGRLTFETSELTTYNLTVDPGFGLGIRTYNGTEPKRQHNVVVTDLFPGLNHTVQLTVTDLANLPSSTQTFTVQARPFTDSNAVTVMADLKWAGPMARTFPPGGLSASVDAQVDFKTFLTPVQDHVVIARVLVNGANAGSNLSTATKNFCVNQVPYPSAPPQIPGGVPGPFVVSGVTNSAGKVTMNFSLTGLSLNDEIVFTIEAVSPLDLANPNCILTTGPNLSPSAAVNIPINWSFPDTKKAFRAISFTY